MQNSKYTTGTVELLLQTQAVFSPNKNWNSTFYVYYKNIYFKTLAPWCIIGKYTWTWSV